MKAFDVMETTIQKVHQAIQAGNLTVRALVEAYLARIRAYDQAGPKLNAIILVNPKALEEADRLDRLYQETSRFSEIGRASCRERV